VKNFQGPYRESKPELPILWHSASANQAPIAYHFHTTNKETVDKGIAKQKADTFKPISIRFGAVGLLQRAADIFETTCKKYRVRR